MNGGALLWEVAAYRHTEVNVVVSVTSQVFISMNGGALLWEVAAYRHTEVMLLLVSQVKSLLV